MFEELYEALIGNTNIEELKERIRFFVGKDSIETPMESGKYHMIVARSFNWIGNAADEMGDVETGQMAREIRDEIIGYLEE